MLKRLVNEVHFTVTITTKGPVLVQSGHATLSGPDMAPVLTRRGDHWQVYLPGSSLKGVIRSHLEKVGRTLRPESAVVCNPFHDLPQEDASCGRRFQARKDDDQTVDSQVAYRDACPICRLFGSTEFIGRVSINDAYLSEWNGFNPVESRDGVGIDRLTGGASHEALFELEAVSPGVSFESDVHLRNFEAWQLGMLLLVAQDMEDGLIRIGSGTSRGLGSVEGHVAFVDVSHLGALSDKPANEIWGLGKFHSPAENEAYGTRPDDVLALDTAPSETRRGIRMQARFEGDSMADLRQKAVAAFIERLQSWQVPDEMRFGEGP
jgi:CRISPR-associated RAMP protein (TIGR02581 family)